MRLRQEGLGKRAHVTLETLSLKLSRDDARIDILHDGVGAVNAIVIGFSVTADPGARRLAEERSVELRTYTWKRSPESGTSLRPVTSTGVHGPA
jgi:hypothetical protein